MYEGAERALTSVAPARRGRRTDVEKRHGGRRANAGRPREGATPRKTLSISVDEDTYRWLLEHAERQNVPPGRLIDRLFHMHEHESI